MLALEIFNWKEKENARLPNTYGARLYVDRASYTYTISLFSTLSFSIIR